YHALVEELRWLYDGDRRNAEYHTGDLEELTRSWRKERIHNLETFKEYHRDFVTIAGALKVANHIEEREFNRWFWAGLHKRTRDRLEKRMQDDDPNLDIRTPFPVRKVIKAAEYVYSRERFDKFLLDPPKRDFRQSSSRKVAWQRSQDKSDDSS